MPNILLIVDIDNKISIDRDTPSFYKIESQYMSTPLRIIFSGITNIRKASSSSVFEGDVLTAYFSFTNKKPIESNYNYRLKEIINKKEYLLHFGISKKVFEAEFIYVSFFSNHSINFNVSFTFGIKKIKRTISQENLDKNKNKYDIKCLKKLPNIKKLIEYYFSNENELDKLIKKVKDIKNSKRSMKNFEINMIQKNICNTDLYKEKNKELSLSFRNAIEKERNEYANKRRKKLFNSKMLKKTVLIHRWEIKKQRVN